jgi:hypothetical protein
MNRAGTSANRSGGCGSSRHPQPTLYRVERNRGAEVVRETLGEDFGGMQVSDCLASYGSVDSRKHKCFAHHLRALKEQAEALQKRGITSAYLAAWKWVLNEERHRHMQPPRRVLSEELRHEGAGPATSGGKSAQPLATGSGRGEVPEPVGQTAATSAGMSGGTGRGADQQPGGTRPETRGDIDRKLSCGNRTLAAKRAN